jgi:hypothetical protein
MVSHTTQAKPVLRQANFQLALDRLLPSHSSSIATFKAAFLVLIEQSISAILGIICGFAQ